MMLARIVFTAVVCLAACTVGRADDPVPGVPVVLGDSGVGPEAAVAPAQPARESVLVEEPRPVSDLPEFAVPDSVLPCDAGPQWHTAYTVVDALFMGRPNTVGPLAVVSQGATTDAGAPVIAAGDVRYTTAPGVRVFQGWRRPDCTGIEVGYLGVWGLHADTREVSPTDDLALPGQLGFITDSGFEAATTVQPTLHSSLNSAEINVFGTHIHQGCRRHDPLPWRRSWDLFEGTTLTSDWLFGVRWAGIDETATLAVTAPSTAPGTADNTTDYRVTTSSQLIGPQVGHRRRVDWTHWSLEGWAKVGLMGGFQSQSQSSVIGPADLVEIREPRSSTRAGVGMIGDLNAAVVRRLGDHCGLRAGYTLLWFSGVAPAAEQWDFTDATTSGTRVVPGTVFLHGATLGLEAAW
jgi:hypothetical protein